MRKTPKRPPLPDNLAVPRVDALDETNLDTVERVIEFCKRNNLINKNEVDIESLITKNPFLNLKKTPLPAHIDAYIKPIGDGIYEIGINSNHSITRQRFSMAHEYAHYQLHKNKLINYSDGESILFRNDETDSIEHQANKFASLILIPQHLLEQSIKENKINTQMLAKEFNVSKLALEFRIKDL